VFTRRGEFIKARANTVRPCKSYQYKFFIFMGDRKGRPYKKITQFILKQGFQRVLAPFGRGVGGQRPPTLNIIELILVLIKNQSLLL